MSEVLKSFETDDHLIEVVSGVKTGNEFYDEKACLIRITTLGNDIVPQINTVMAAFEADDLSRALNEAAKEAGWIETSASRDADSSHGPNERGH